MSKQKKTGEQKPAGQAGEKHEKDEPQDSSDAGVVDRMIEGFEEKVKAGKVNLTVGDFIRLMQLRKDSHAEEPKEVRVTWVEPIEKESANKT
jgi:hypothetical protein